MSTPESAFRRRLLTSEQFTTRQVLGMLLPLVLDQLFIYLILLLTTSMISSSGQDSVTAVSLVQPIHHMSLAMFTAFASGGAVIIAQYKGHGDEQKVREAIGQTVFLIMAMGLVFSLLLVILSGPIVELFFGKAEASVISKAKLMLAGMAVNNFVHALRVAATAGFRGLGDVKTNLTGTILINLSFFFFSLIFLNLLHMDIMGTLLSYFLSRSLGMLHSFYYLFLARKSRIHISFRDAISPKRDYLRRIIRLGIPFSTEELFFNGGTILVSSYMILLGTAAVAANAIANSVFQTVFAPTLAVGILSTTVIGQCIGAGNQDLARWYGRRLVLLGYVVMALTIGVTLIFLRPLITIYHPTAESLVFLPSIMTIGLIGSMLLYPPAFIFPNILKAAGDADYPSLVSLISMWAVRVLAGYLVAIPLGFGILGVWVMMGVEWLVRGIFFLLRFRGKTWLSKRSI